MEKIIPWSSLPKWVYNQRVSDRKEDLPYWYRDTDGLNNFCVKFVPLPNDPYIDEINLEGGVVEIFAMSKHQLLAALRAYKKTFNRFYADDDYWEEYGKAEWEEFEHDKKHNGGPNDFYSWKRWKKAQKKGKVTE